MCTTALAPANCIQLFTGAGDNYLLLHSVDGLIFTDNIETKYFIYTTETMAAIAKWGILNSSETGDILHQLWWHRGKNRGKWQKKQGTWDK